MIQNKMKTTNHNYVLAFSFSDNYSEGIRFYSEMESNGCNKKIETIVKKFATKKEAADFASENDLGKCWIESLSGKNRYDLNLNKINSYNVIEII